MRAVLSATVLALSLAACSAGDNVKPEPGDADDATGTTAVVASAPPAPIEPSQHHVALFDGSALTYTYVLHGTAGQRISVYADGTNGLDTVVYLYRVSHTTGRRYGTAIAMNDDTAASGWTRNAYSSSLDHVVLPATLDYAIVARTYSPSATGHATVWFDIDLPTHARPPAFGGTGAPTPLQFAGIAASALPIGAELSTLARQAQGAVILGLSRVQVAPHDAQTLVADAARLGTFAYDVMYYANTAEPGPTLNYHGPAQVTPLAARDAAATLQRASADASDAHLAQAEAVLVASMLGDGDFATGGARVFKTHWDNNDDTNAEGVLAVDTTTGEVRAVTFINPP